MSNIIVYSGPMKCGKTQEILNEYKRQLIAGKKVKMFKPKMDNRTIGLVQATSGIDIPAIEINRIQELENYNADVYCVDEFQLLKGSVEIIQKMADSGKKFYIAGLNLTSEKKPFGKMSNILCIADEIHMMKSICDNCKCEEGVYSYYKGGKDTDIVLDNKEYLSLCRECYDEISHKDNLKKIIVI